MANKPILILQARRLGDVILTFPLIGHLQNLFPGHPIWMAAPETFYKPLIPFSPSIVFFPLGALPQLARHEYEAVINLGGSEALAICAGKAKANLKLGLIKNDQTSRIQGFWQLYRESLTLNNHHNIFHWADLFRMDFGVTPFASSTAIVKNNRRIGLFVGASEAAKRPDADFWAVLAKRLSARNFKPILLGGPAEAGLGEEIMAQKAPAINFCGKTDLTQLAKLLVSLDLLITPDTGPMHLANWLSAPVLNLSMGNVNAAETGPYWSGQHILRANISCKGCWRCHRPKLNCKQRFVPAQAVQAASILLSDDQRPLAPGLELLTVGRDAHGLHALQGEIPNTRVHLDNFWKAAFLYFYNADNADALKQEARNLFAAAPAIATHLKSNLERIFLFLSGSRRSSPIINDVFWKNQPLHSRLFAGHIHMELQNGDFSPSAYAQVFGRIEGLMSFVET